MSGIEIAIASVGVAIGALVQGAIGFGLALVAVPPLGLMEPTLLPATMLILSFPLTLWMAMNERGAVDRPGLLQILPGRLVGTAAGAWVVGAVTDSDLSVVIGVAIVTAVVMSVVAPELELGRGSRAAAGFLSGLMGTAASVGGPPLALAYQRRPGPELRSTLAASFAIGTFFSLAALRVAGRVEIDHLIASAQLTPALLVGLAVATRYRRLVDRGWLRPAVLTFAGLSGAAAVAKGLL